MGKKWAYVALVKTRDGIQAGMFEGAYQQCDDLTQAIGTVPVKSGSCYFRVEVDTAGTCSFSYSLNNETYTPIGRKFQAVPGVWIGAKAGLFCISPNIPESKGYSDFDWFRVR